MLTCRVCQRTRRGTGCEADYSDPRLHCAIRLCQRDFHFTRLFKYFDSDGVIRTTSDKINLSIPNTEALNANLVNTRWQDWTREVNFFRRSIYAQSQARLNEHEHRSRRPSLRRAGHWIERRSAGFRTTMEAAKQFR